ncbi:acyl transferase domain-containing protein [Nakamurella sp. UYEF19]|uniref:type I polyketide synthase n=1 Tax=Nakamurella sp. UYEF19 TaxID=1756392 RepID=UPI0033971DC7
MANEDKLREYLKKAAADLVGYRERVQELERRTSEPIAIVSMACRYPGGVNSPGQLWDLIAAQRDVMGGFPTDRGWDISGLDLPDGFEAVGSFLTGAADFDPEFFEISPREAAAMDPQQRHLLETAWEAFEHGYLDPITLRGSRTGVFAGQMYSEYGSDPRTIEESARAFLGTGRATSVLSGRLSYVFGLEGPAVTIDTACSSSLVAMHLAMQALRNDECDLALAGGVTVMVTPDPVLDFARQGNLGAGGLCKAFADAADGTGLGEGAGMLLLERLSDAQRHGHQILALVKGSAVNQDGASNGLTAPNGPSQQRVIRAALANAGLQAAAVDAVEAHGTGTALGDPIEAQALIATYGRAKEPATPLWLGSVKSNIGHTQGAAGVAGVIKMVEAMRHGILPATLHVDQPSRQVDWSAGTVELLTRARPWPSGEAPRRAAVSSFGISGTNAHVILEQAPMPAVEADSGSPVADETADLPTGLPGDWAPWVLSGRTPDALKDQAARLLAHLDPAVSGGDLATADIARTLLSRSRFEHQAVVFGTDRPTRRANLAALAAGNPSLGTATGSSIPGSLGILFTGQGSQYAGMGQDLYQGLPVFATAFDEVCQAFSSLLEHPLRDVVFAAPDSAYAALLNSTAYTQPALFALETALFRLVSTWGATPKYLAGHSVGEITAAHIAGVISLADAAKLVAHRARLMQALPSGGAMLAVALEEDEARAHLADGVDLAAVNGPAAVVLSGSETGISELAETLVAQGVRHKRLVVSHAFHSALMRPMLEEFEAVARSVTFRPPAIDIISTVTGRQVGINEMRDPMYWVRQIPATVHFRQAVLTMARSGVSTFLELGPDAVLTAMATHTLEADTELAARRTTVITALRRDRSALATLTTAVGQLSIAGRGIELADLFTDGRPIPLPTYAFQHQRFWLQPLLGADVSRAGLTEVGHPLLGAAVSLADTGAVVLTGRLTLTGTPWLADHRIGGAAVVPGTALAEMVIRAGLEVGCRRITELTLQRPMVVGGRDIDLQITIGTAGVAGLRQVSVHARSAADSTDSSAAGDWTLHAAGSITPDDAAPTFDDDWDPADAPELDVTELHQGLALAGIEYGPAFTGLHRAWLTADGDVLAEVQAPESVSAQGFAVHPALLDAALQSVGLIGDRAPGLPFAFTGVTLTGSTSPTLRVRVSTRDGATALTLSDPTGLVIGRMDGVSSREITGQDTSATAAATAANALFEIQWIEAADVVLPTTPADILIVDALLTDARPAAFVAVRCYPTANHQAGENPAADAFSRTAAVLETVQSFLGNDRFADSTLVLLTRGAVAIDPAHSPTDLPGAALLGLARSAQSENPGRLLLIDADTDLDDDGIRAVVVPGESQLAVRDGGVLVPRLRPFRGAGEIGGPAWDPAGTVVITGGTGALGVQVARHLVNRHRITRLLLLSRSGPEAPGADGLITELAALGATTQVLACDVSDETSISAALRHADSDHPVRAVVHTAGVLQDSSVTAMSAEQLRAVFPAKVSAGWALHRATAGLDLEQFVLFSSSAGVMGAAGQGNYAAANSFVDALAAHRCAQGLPATSLSWGLWDSTSGMAGALSDEDRRRMAQAGVTPLSIERGLALFDLAVGTRRAHFVPIALTLPRGADPAAVPALIRDLIPAPSRTAAGQGGQAAGPRALRSAPSARRAAFALTLVRQAAAAVLGHAGIDTVDPVKPFTELGLNSLTAIELRNQVAQASGLTLAPTLVFDHPSCQAVADLILQMVQDENPDKNPSAAAEPSGARTRRTTDHDDPIVIVGMACRYPGEVDTPEALWDLILSGRDAISGFPTDRGWDLDNLYHPDPSHPGTSYTRHGGFLHDAGRFDAAFFGISPREAVAMDPQQRLLLETSWEAVESAGIDPQSLRGSRTGVFAGAMYHDYASSLGEVPEGVEGFIGTGTAGSVVAGRVSYVFGLEGPALTIDTACSSSLVALHSAVLALQAGECDYALAGGVAVMSTPGSFIDFSRQRGLAADGRCKPFAAAADGTAWGEGAGMLLVERLSHATELGHRVLAVVRGSAVNQDGASNGLTAPNGPSQQRVIRAALAAAGLTTSDVDVVEAHGTGTSLGDPIEAQALLATYGQHRTADRPVLLGSLKSNIGHTQAAAGVGGIIKMVQAMSHGVVPGLLHLDEPSPYVDWTAGAVQLVTTPTMWVETGDRPRRCAVSSFGFSGTNSHVILEAPAALASVTAADTPTAVGAATKDVSTSDAGHPWVLSARTSGALRGQAGALLRALESGAVPGSDADIAHTLAGRTRFAHRAVVLGSNPTERRLNLGLLSAARDTAGVVTGKAGSGGLGLLFTGQGSQRIGMGRGLYESFPAYAAAFDAVCAAFDGLLEQPLSSVVFAEAGSPQAALIDRTEYTQPALFAMETALFRLAESVGLVPTVLAGHSIGEIAAAHVAGVFDLAGAATLVAARGRLMQALPSGGAMVAVEATESEVAPFLTAGVDLAAVNSPTSLVLSGALASVHTAAKALAGQGKRVKRLTVSHAFHSELMDPMLADFAAAIADVEMSEPLIPIISGMTGQPATDGLLSDPAYWVEHVRATVRFADAATSMAQSVSTLLELGPDAVLTAMAGQTLGSSAVRTVPSQRRDRPDREAMIEAWAALETAGHNIDWAAIDRGGRFTALPTYAFQRKNYWLASGGEAGRRTTTEEAFWAAVDGADGATLAVELLLSDEAAAALRLLLPELTRWRQETSVDSAGAAAVPEDHDETDDSGPSLAEQLAPLPAGERLEVLIGLVLSQTATVLGHADSSDLEPEQDLLDLGFNSLTAVELRNRLEIITLLELPAALVYEFTSAREIGEFVLTRMSELMPA